MIKSISNKTLFFYVIINFAISSALTILMWYTGKFLEGVMHYIAYVLFLPSFFIISLFKGVNATMHFTRYRTFLFVSFVFYSFVAAVIQLIILKCKKV
jgi:hypothetical protein